MKFLHIVLRLTLICSYVYFLYHFFFVARDIFNSENSAPNNSYTSKYFQINDVQGNQMMNLTLNQTIITLSENWTIYWSVPSPYVCSNTWIGVYPYGSATKLNKFASFLDLNSTRKGNGTLYGPKEAGLYDIRYVKDNNKKALATLGRILVNPKGKEIWLNVSNLNTTLGEKVSLAWTIKNLDKHIFGTPYICLNQIGVNDKCILEHSISDFEGKKSLEMPRTAGYYIFRLLITEATSRGGKSITCLFSTQLIKNSHPSIRLSAISLSTVIGGAVSSKWESDKGDSLDWIGLYSFNTEDGPFSSSSLPLQSFRTNGSVTGSFNTILPPNSQAGDFMFVYHQNNIPVAVSDLIHATQPVVNCPGNRKTMSNIKHLVIICTENHSFDSYYGNYCQAKPGSKPKCTDGPSCCERPPEILEGYKPRILNDTTNMDFDPSHSRTCEECEIGGGKMDGYISGCLCSNSSTFAVADPNVVKVLHDYSRSYATADNFFHSAAGASCMNNMYLARASYVFDDNSLIPVSSIGGLCYYLNSFMPDYFSLYYDPSTTDILAKCGFQLKTYAEGYTTASETLSPSQCSSRGYDSSDIPFNYYASAIDDPHFIGDYQDYFEDIQKGTLADVSFLKPLIANSAHPKSGTITDEQNFIKKTVDAILNSKYKNDTLIIWLPDESGGYYDHVSPPITSDVDHIPYGPRIPVLAIGKFAKKNFISHQEMEHSSIVKFIEWNWLSGETGHLNTRDRTVNNIGDLLNETETGIAVPAK